MLFYFRNIYQFELRRPVALLYPSPFSHTADNNLVNFVLPVVHAMKIFSLIVYYKGGPNTQVRLLKGAYDLSSFSFFQRGSVQEFMSFTGKIITERSSQPSRSSVKEQEYMVHAYVRADGLSGVLVADSEYPQRVAFTLITRILDDFAAAVAPADWPTVNEGAAPFRGLDPALAKYQDPHQADSMTRLQDEVDETKIVLHDTIQKVLERGEKLDDLVEKSEGLSAQSKMFYKSAKKMNKCCTWV